MLINTHNLNKSSEKAIKAYIEYDLLDIKADEYSNYPIYDGDLMVYKKPNGNSDGFRPIRIQIKGTTATKDSFTIERNEAEAYLSENGIIFFTVYFKKIDDNNYDEKDFVITYNALTKNALKMLLAEADKKTIELKMKEVPEDVNEFYKICSNFLIDKNLQTNYLDCSELLKDKPIKAITMKSVITSKTEDAIHEMLSDNLKYPRTLLVKFEDETEQIISDVQMSYWGTSADFTIKVKDKVFYNKVERVNGRNRSFLLFGNSFQILYKPSYEFKYNLDGNVYQYIHDIEFLLAVKENDGFELNDKHFALTLSDETGEELKNKLKQLKTIKEVSEIVGFTSEIKPNKITQKEFSDMMLLYSKSCIKSGIYTFTLAQKSALIFVDSDCNFNNLFDAAPYLNWKIKLNNGKELENVSPFITLRQDSLEKYDNFHFSKIEETIFNQAVNEDSLALTNLFVLELISYYDKSKKIPVLLSAQKIAKWLVENDDSDYLKINLYQINKRLNTILTDSEIEDLLSIKDKSKDGLTKCAICILLESKIEFINIFNRLKEEEQSQLKSFPIYNLYDEKTE
ncbi:MAG: hypothetical protein ACI4L1_02045 [Christensenellales bacterium]